MEEQGAWGMGAGAGPARHAQSPPHLPFAHPASGSRRTHCPHTQRKAPWETAPAALTALRRALSVQPVPGGAILLPALPAHPLGQPQAPMRVPGGGPRARRPVRRLRLHAAAAATPRMAPRHSPWCQGGTCRGAARPSPILCLLALTPAYASLCGGAFCPPPRPAPSVHLTPGVAVQLQQRCSP